jgi:hypothetical protein
MLLWMMPSLVPQRRAVGDAVQKQIAALPQNRRGFVPNLACSTLVTMRSIKQ